MPGGKRSGVGRAANKFSEAEREQETSDRTVGWTKNGHSVLVEIGNMPVALSRGGRCKSEGVRVAE